MGDNEKQASEARQSGVFILALTALGFVAFLLVAVTFGWMDV